MGDLVFGMLLMFMFNKFVKKLVGRKIVVIMENKYVFWFIFFVWYWCSLFLMIFSLFKKKFKVLLICVIVLMLWCKCKCWFCVRVIFELR